MKETNIEAPLGGFALFRWLWRQLTSMRTALLLLMLLGLGSIPGSLFPQRTQNPMKVRDYLASHGSVGVWLDRLRFFDVYSSPWFSAIYLLLFISLIGCVLPRTLEHLKAIGKAPPLTPRNLDRMEGYEILSAGDLDKAQAWLRKKRFRIRRDENSISAEKGYSRETGNLLFHLSLILILVAVGVGSLFGSKGEAIVNVGERFINTPTSYDSLAFGKFQSDQSMQSFSLRVTDFSAKYDPATNAPQDYTLTVAAARPIGSSEKKVVIKVNSPLTVVYASARNGASSSNVTSIEIFTRISEVPDVTKLVDVQIGGEAAHLSLNKGEKYAAPAAKKTAPLKRIRSGNGEGFGNTKRIPS